MDGSEFWSIVESSTTRCAYEATQPDAHRS